MESVPVAATGIIILRPTVLDHRTLESVNIWANYNAIGDEDPDGLLEPDAAGKLGLDGAVGGRDIHGDAPQEVGNAVDSVVRCQSACNVGSATSNR